jgi:DNA helicase HerA-like ATPase
MTSTAGAVHDTASEATTAWSVDGRSFSFRAGVSAGWRAGDNLTAYDDSGTVRLGLVEDVQPSGDDTVTGVGSFLRVTGGDGSPSFRSDRVERSPSADIAAFFADAGAVLTVGSLASAPEVPFGLVPRRLNRHTFWCGQSGSGKTFALGVALEQILQHTALPMVIFDPNSDFVRLDTPREAADPGEAAAIHSRDIRVLRPGSGPGSLRVRFLSMTSQARAAIMRLDPLIDRGEYNAMQRFASSFGGVASGDPKGLAAQLRAQGEPGYEALAERLENLGVLNWQIWAGDLTPVTDVIAERPDATVVDLGAFSNHEEQLAVALAVLDDLWLRRDERRPVLLVIDEAHNLCSPDVESLAARAVRDRIIQIAAEGRKFGLWLLLSTQRPGKVHRGIVSQCDNLTLMRMNSPNDLVELADIFGFVPPAMLTQASRFRQGEALLAGGFVPAPGIIRIRDRVTVEGGIDVGVPLRD